jgi:hypothetical protein
MHDQMIRSYGNQLISLYLLALSLGCSWTEAGKRIDALDGGLRREAPTQDKVSKSNIRNQETDSKRTQLGRGVWLETKGNARRVIIEASVCLREGEYGLECLLCRNGTKEHESVLHTGADAKLIHAGLLAAGAKPGAPVQYREVGNEIVTTPPTGDRVKISLKYEEKGKQVTIRAQDWVRNSRSKVVMNEGWIFAGSRLWENQKTGKMVYGANAEGGYICTSNVPTAILDVPFASPKSLEGRSFEPFSEHIPPVDTRVLVILETMMEGN